MYIAVPCTGYGLTQDTTVIVFYTLVQKFVVIGVIFEFHLNGSLCKLYKFINYFGHKSFRCGTCGLEVLCSIHITLYIPLTLDLESFQYV